MLLTSGHIAGIALTMILVTAVGLYSSRKVKTAEDFSTAGRKAGSSIVAGTIMGTLVSGASTIGTAQLAFQYGFCAWWFTLGAGIGCAILGLGMARRLYKSSVETVPQYLVKTYGTGIGPISSIFTSLGILFGLVAQILAFSALLTSLFTMQPTIAACIGMVLVIAYVLFGGVWGTGLTGIVKLILLYVTVIACGVTAFIFLGGISGMTAAFPSFPWFSLFGRGVSIDLAAGFSLIVGVLSTQTYIQAVVSGNSAGTARTGALISALLAPPIGIGGIVVGLFMRANFPGTPSTEVLPVFILKFFPPLFAGVALAALMITVVGGWAGLTLGISTMMTKDIYQRFLRPSADSREVLLVQRVLIIVICLIGLLFAAGNMGSLILSWSFMSMGLRGCTVLFPLLGAMFFPRWVTPKAGIAAALLGPLVDCLWKIVYPTGIDPLYPGLAASLFVLITVSVFTKKKVLAGDTS
jgi:SSS family solute:Na+ symporter